MQFGRARTFIALLALLTVAIGIIVPAHARAEPVAPPDDALKLHSVPGADRVIYLDFEMGKRRVKATTSPRTSRSPVASSVKTP